LALVFFAFGLMSKPMLVTVPFALLLLDYWPLKRFRLSTLSSQTSILWRLFVEKLPFFALSAASSAATFWAQKSGGAVAPLELFSIGDRVANALVSYARYLGKAIWPVDLVITCPHPGQWAIAVIASVALLMTGFTAAVIALGRRHPYLAVGWFWYLGTLVPVIGLVQVGIQAIADRYTYVPLIGIFIAVSWGISELLSNWRHRQIALAGAASLILLLCAVTTHAQLTHWRNGEAILGRAVKLTSGNFIAEKYLADAIALQGRFDEAISHYQQALRINPSYADAHNNLGFTLAQQGKGEEAMEHYRQALRINPDHKRAHNNLGLALAETGKFEEAASHFAAVVRLEPQDADALYNLANALAGQEKFAEAEPYFQAVVRLKPDDAEAREKLGRALARQGKAAEAAAQFAEVLRLRPDGTAHYNLALALVMQGKSESAITHYREAIWLKPEWPVAMNDLAWILATHPKAGVRNGVEAIRLAERACELAQRKEAAFLGTLDAAYAEAGRFADAIATAKQARNLALANGQKVLAELAERRLKLYEARQPYRQN